jgi:hypothetical protein
MDEVAQRKGGIMMYRQYFWFRGTPDKRPGGPWHYRDFTTKEERARFLMDLAPFLHARALLDSNALPIHDPMGVCPPLGSIFISPITKRS